MVHQELQPVPARSIAENMFLGRYPTINIGPLKVIDHKKMENEATKWLKEVKLNVNPNALLQTLSISQMQSVEIAKAVSMGAKIIILDEPTSALDIHNREQIILILKEQLAKGKTLITVTHDYHLARELGGKMLVMYQGAIMEEGQVAKLLESPSQTYSQDLILGNPYERLVRDDAGM